jgi:hypothetical protein
MVTGLNAKPKWLFQHHNECNGIIWCKKQATKKPTIILP